MNNDIQRAVVGLFDRCFEITEAGRYQVTMTYQGSANAVFVTIYPACSDTVVFRDHVFISGMPFTTDMDVLDQLRSLTDRVCEFQLESNEEAA